MKYYKGRGLEEEGGKEGMNEGVLTPKINRSLCWESPFDRAL